MPSLTESYCLFCGKKVPFYRLASAHQFCTAAHEAAFAQEQTRLAVETLHRTHDALKAYIPSVAVEDILGPDPTPQATAWEAPEPVLERPAAQLVDLASAVHRAPEVEVVHFGESLQKLASPQTRGFWATLLRWLGLS